MAIVKYVPEGPPCKIVSPVQSVEPQSSTLPEEHAKNAATEESKPKYDRNAAHKAYMKEYMRDYMREWRKTHPRKKPHSSSLPGTST